MDTAKYTLPSVKMDERPDGYDFKFVIPGVGKGCVDLDVEGRTLVLKTHAKHQNPAGFRQVAAEFEYDDYAASVDLPEMADPATLKASLTNGILSVSVAKRPETQARRIEIA
ncbi:MAG: Hsp20/alpha crystallin family protein [Kiritimatiellae bacterium]|nr:Hsp20/alpha crystallin family protein [Kiritimatiellia bacterium]